MPVEKNVNTKGKLTSWGYCVRVPTGEYDTNGREIKIQKRKAGFKTKADAEKAERDLLNRADEGILPNNEKSIFGELAEKFLEYVKKSSEYSEGTYSNYNGYNKNHLHNMQNVPIFRIDNLCIEKWQLNAVDNGTSPWVINGCRKFMLACFKYGRKHNKALKRLPFDKEEFKKVTEPKKIRNRLPQKEIIRMLNTCACNHNKFSFLIFCVFCVAMGTGLRVGEECALAWTDINFETGETHINKQYTRGKLKYKTKTDNSSRVIYLPPFILQILMELKKATKVLSEYIFINPETGKIISQKTIDRRFKDLLEVMGCPRDYIRYHDIRGCYAGLMRTLKVSRKYTSDGLGHASTHFTDDVYAFTSQDDVDYANNAIEASIFKHVNLPAIKEGMEITRL